MSEETAEKETRRIDKIRAFYYQFYTDTKWGDRNNYDLVINSGAFGIDNVVNIIKDIAPFKFTGQPMGVQPCFLLNFIQFVGLKPLTTYVPHGKLI